MEYDNAPCTRRDPGGEPDGGRELVDAYVVELDPVEDGFSGVVVELCLVDEGGALLYEVRYSAALTANRLLVFRTGCEERARAVFDGYISPARTPSPTGAAPG